MARYVLSDDALDGPEIAVVGIAARLPGANDYFDYFRNLREGRESIRRLSDEELRAAGVTEDELHDPNYVKVAAGIDRLELFDAGYFGFSKREATVLDPQHRHFLEVCVEALEDAGIRPATFDGAIGVFGGSGMNAYMPYNLFTNPDLMRSMGLFLVRHTGNDKDFLTTRVSYCLDLRGPSVNVQTACSTSLVAIHAACQSLIAGECDVALAGGVTIELPHDVGYRYEEGEILSPDGRCRPFDGESKGTVFGSGAGVVVLRRLKDAVDGGDYIHSLVIGSAVNNDGRRKVGYLAPSVEGQAECVVEALQVAGVSPRDVSYVECHGTGTPIGDPIEVRALQQAFQRTTGDKQYCGIGSVKSNIGHLDTAAGVASFIKVTQMLEHGALVPTLHFQTPNPAIDFPATPFYVVDEARPWARADKPRRAGVSSLGVGGTNAHVVVEEPPARAEVAAEGPHILLITARSEASRAAFTGRLVRHFQEHPGLDAAEVSSTLLHGREWSAHRRVVAARDLAEARALLEAEDKSRVFDVVAPRERVPVVFLFPGGGAQFANMARDLYEGEPVFRDVLDQCFSILERQERLDVRSVLYPPPDEVEAASQRLESPSLALPALFAIELAYARLLGAWGITPVAMLGHSLGEYTAAHLAGVLTLEAALGIVCCRGRLFESAPRGGMLSVPMGPEELEPLLGERLSIAAVNGPGMSVVSGDRGALDELAAALAAKDVDTRRLLIDVPAHSPLLEPILEEFREYLRSVSFGAPTRPYVSNRTARFVEATDPSAEYFVDHLRHTVRFSEGLETLLTEHPDAIVVEVGPGQSLTSLVRQHPARRREQAIVPTSPHAKETGSAAVFFATSVGRIWAHGAAGDERKLGERVPRSIVPLPPTPFEHERYWVQPGAGYFRGRGGESSAGGGAAAAEREADPSRWFYRSVFREEPRAPSNASPGERWLVLVDEGRLAESLGRELRAQRIEPVFVIPAAKTERLDGDRGEIRYGLALGDPAGYERVLRQILETGALPCRVLHALCLGDALLDPSAVAGEPELDRAFFSLMHLAQALLREDLGAGIELLVATSGAYAVADSKVLRPLHALCQGPALVIPKEIPEIRARVFDRLELGDVDATARALIAELASPTSAPIVAVRGNTRYVQRFERASGAAPDAPSEAAPATDAGTSTLPAEPVILVTGGLGGIARTLGKHFADAVGARLVLFSRSALPPEAEWEAHRARLDANDPRAEQLDWLLALRAAGREVLVVSGDVSRLDDVRRGVGAAVERFGRVDVVVHAAGVIDDGPLALATRERTRAVLAPKVLGVQALVDALAELRAEVAPALVLSIGSSSAALGPPGQIDYVAANAFVDAMARRGDPRLPRTRFVCLGFGVWREAGMALAAAKGALPSPAGELVEHPLLGRRTPSGAGTEFQSHYAPESHWVLGEHRIRGGNPVLPGTAVVEIARAAGSVQLGAASGDAFDAVEIRDLMLVAPLEVPEGGSRLVSVLVEPVTPDSGSTAPPAVEVILRSRGPGEDEATEHARALVARHRGAPSASPFAAPALAIAAIEARCRAHTLLFEEGQQSLPQDERLALGPHWKVLREARFGVGEAIGRLAVPPGLRGDFDRMALDPALLDVLSGFAFSLADPTGTGESLRVPLSYQRVVVFGPLPWEVVSHVRLRSSDEREGIAVFDVDVADPNGRILVAITGYTTKSVVWANRRVAPRNEKPPTLLDRWLRQGITSAEGIEIVERVLADRSLDAVTATPVSLFTMLEELRPRAVASAPAERPRSVRSSGGDDAAPRDDIERTIAGMWSSLLGVDGVGIRDDFFELGGHSLIAVRLFSRIKKTYGVDLSLSVLFQAPTIEACARILREELGLELSPETSVSAPPPAVEGAGHPVSGTRPVAKRAGGFEHLVPIQAGNGKLPLFVVHGAGGNVLNFRDLAVGLGKEQTFFGVQARGVDGGTPSSSVEEMAELYLGEMLQVVPEGPYLVAGYSGGGVVAYEIGQRLLARGKRVDLLAFLDTFHPSTKARTYSLSERVAQLAELGPRSATERAKRKLARHLEEISTGLKMRFITNQGLPMPMELRDLQMTRAFYGAADRYRPLPYPDRVVLFRASVISEVYAHMGPKLGWDALIPNLEIVEVPGDHDSLVLPPNVEVLIAELKKLLAQVGESLSVDGAGAGPAGAPPNDSAPATATSVDSAPHDAASPLGFRN